MNLKIQDVIFNFYLEIQRFDFLIFIMGIPENYWVGEGRQSFVLGSLIG